MIGTFHATFLPIPLLLKRIFQQTLAICLLQGLEIKTAYLQGIENIKQIYSQEKYGPELHHFPKILNGEIQNISIAIIYSSGYVLDTLEVSLWCLLNTVLKAVNLREYTDTKGAITGGSRGDK